jgi:hypothetical protein
MSRESLKTSIKTVLPCLIPHLGINFDCFYINQTPLLHRKIDAPLPENNIVLHLKHSLMKKILPLMLTAFVFGCAHEREVQMNMVNVQLIKIDTIQRYPNSAEQLLTWRSEDNISYITYEPMSMYYAVGSKMKVMIRR